MHEVNSDLEIMLRMLKRVMDGSCLSCHIFAVMREAGLAGRRKLVAASAEVLDKRTHLTTTRV